MVDRVPLQFLASHVAVAHCTNVVPLRTLNAERMQGALRQREVAFLTA